jgi:hypothetical protein
VRFPNAVLRVVYPVPPAVVEALDAPAAKRRSAALVVVTEPLFIALPVPIADLVTSTGLTLSIPEYSWM